MIQEHFQHLGTVTYQSTRVIKEIIHIIRNDKKTYANKYDYEADSFVRRGLLFFFYATVNI